MGYFKGYYTLDDAFAFLTETRGLPNITASSFRIRRLLRACIMLSWVALEDALEDALDDWKEDGKSFPALPTGLKNRILYVFTTLSLSPLNESEFDRLRAIRNRLAHPKATDPETKFDEETARQTFEFCLSIIRSLSPYPVVCPVGTSDVIQNYELSVRCQETPTPNE